MVHRIGYFDANEELAIDSQRYNKINDAQLFIYNAIARYRFKMNE